MDGSWEPVEGGFVDTANNTVSVSAEHLSFWQILEDPLEAVYDVVGIAQSITGEETKWEYYYDLPSEIKQDILNEGVKPQDVTAVINAKLSLVTKAASAVIPISNIISKTAGLTIAVIEDTTEAIV